MANGSDPLVVPAAELAAALLPLVTMRDEQYRDEVAGAGWRQHRDDSRSSTGGLGTHGHTPYLGGYAWLEARSRIDRRQIRRALDGQQQWVTLRIADALCTGAGIPEALRDGTINIVPNPSWDLARWAQHMHACGIDNPDAPL